MLTTILTWILPSLITAALQLFANWAKTNAGKGGAAGTIADVWVATHPEAKAARALTVDGTPPPPEKEEAKPFVTDDQKNGE